MQEPRVARADAGSSERTMKRHIGSITLVVRDYDEAIAYYTGALGFELLEDTPLGDGKRWVRVAPAGSNETALLLAQAATTRQRAQHRRPDRRAASASSCTPTISRATTPR